MEANKRTYKPRKRRSATKQKRRSSLSALLSRNPRAVWWTSSAICVCVYMWAFYSYFVSPTGFRWRALFGDTNYPAGYEIHGIDISHYQGTIDWDKLRDRHVSTD